MATSEIQYAYTDLAHAILADRGGVDHLKDTKGTFAFTVYGSCACGGEDREEVIILSTDGLCGLAADLTRAAIASGIPEADFVARVSVQIDQMREALKDAHDVGTVVPRVP